MHLDQKYARFVGIFNDLVFFS